MVWDISHLVKYIYMHIFSLFHMLLFTAFIFMIWNESNTFIPKTQLFQNLTLKIQGQDQGCDQSPGQGHIEIDIYRRPEHDVLSHEVNTFGKNSKVWNSKIKQNKTKVNTFGKNLEFKNKTKQSNKKETHTHNTPSEFRSWLIKCVNMKWIWLILCKIQSGTWGCPD